MGIVRSRIEQIDEIDCTTDQVENIICCLRNLLLNGSSDISDVHINLTHKRVKFIRRKYNG